jgi:metal-responsive CopG/Arc/MetJ family transcriptional regulator
MARKQVLVQLDDELVEALDRIAEREDTNRSELLRRGARALVTAAELADADAALTDAYRQHPQDAALVEALARQAAGTAAW